MNKERHIKSHLDLHGHLARGETEKAEAIRTFYDEYFAVLDLTAEFYLETIDKVFQRALLPKGELTYKGRPVDPSAIRRTACSPSRASATTSARSARRWRPTTSSPSSSPSASATTCRRASAITACSAGASGRGRSIPSSAT